LNVNLFPCKLHNTCNVVWKIHDCTSVTISKILINWNKYLFVSLQYNTIMYSLISVYRHKYEMNRIYGRKFGKTHSYPKFRTRKHHLNHFSISFCFILHIKMIMIILFCKFVADRHNYMIHALQNKMINVYIAHF